MSVPSSPNEYFKTTDNLDPLLLSSIVNTVSVNDFNKRYKEQSHIGGISNLFTNQTDMDNLMKASSAKKAFCLKNYKNQDVVSYRLPLPENATPLIKIYDYDYKGNPVSQTERALNFFNKEINVSNVQFSDNLKSKLTRDYCDKFMAVYCENMRKDLMDKMGDSYSQSDYALFCPECSCYGDTYKDLQINGYAIPNYLTPLFSVTRKCQLLGCDASKFSPDNNESGEGCGNVNITICNNDVSLSEDTLKNGKEIDIFIEQQNACATNPDDPSPAVPTPDPEPEPTPSEPKPSEPEPEPEPDPTPDPTPEPSDDPSDEPSDDPSSDPSDDSSDDPSDDPSDPSSDPSDLSSDPSSDPTTKSSGSNMSYIIVFMLILTGIIMVVIIVVMIKRNTEQKLIQRAMN